MDDKAAMNDENPMKKQKLPLSGVHDQYRALASLSSTNCRNLLSIRASKVEVTRKVV
jgi:hypothetical protein